MKNKQRKIDVISRPFPKFKITKELLDDIKAHPLRYKNCDADFA